MRYGFKFRFQYDETSPHLVLRIPPDVTLDVVLDSLEDFIRGAGYVLDGKLDVVEEEK